MKSARPQSIRIRLALWYAGIFAVSFLVLGLGLYAQVRRELYRSTDRDLLSRAARVTSFVNSLHGRAEIAKELGEQALASLGTEVRVTDRAGLTVYRSAGAEGWSFSPRAVGGSPEIETRTAQNAARRVLTASLERGTIEIAVPVTQLEEVLQTLTWTLLLGAPLALGGASLGGVWMSRRALEPVNRIALTAERIGAERLSERLAVTGSGDELDRLAVTLNRMFERLEAGVRRIAQFTADASHELRTPVAIIRTAAEVASSRERSAEEHIESWKLVLKETEHATRLVENLMTLARIDAGKERLEFGRADLSECAGAAFDELQLLAAAARLSYRMETAGPAYVTGDGEALRQMTVILLDNAIKYTPAGGSVALRIVPENGGIRLEVRDTGAGIPSADQPRIFDRFYRVAKDRSRQTGGTGLGLAIAQSIAQRHGTEIVCESKEGEGSRFAVRLPDDQANAVRS